MKALKIKDFPDYYVTDSGEVYSRKGNGRFRKLSPSKNVVNNYLFVHLGRGKKSTFIV